MATSTSAAASATTSGDIVDVLRQCGRATRVFVAGVRPNQWSAPTNCDMDVRSLTNHVVAGLSWAAEIASGKTVTEIGSRFEGDVLGNAPLAAYDEAVAGAVAAFGRPGVLSQICSLPYGDVPGAVFCSHKLLDVFIHGWDIARATGQATTLDPDLVTIVYAMFKPHAAMLQASGVFAPPVAVAAESDPQTLLLAMLGRDNRS
ncbi:MAG: TIGR03086 family metal-binding protein [Chloroflexota bacterium]|nr:TIGR03086 family metal-binding protein [Chloroflexota bacterium]